MDVSGFLDKLMEEKQIKLDQLSKELNISLQTLYNLRNGNSNKISRNVLKKLSVFLNVSPEIVAYQCIADRDTSRLIDESALIYLCKKYCSGFGVNIKSKSNNFPFCGAHHKTRTFNSYSLVDGWKTLEMEFWINQYKNHDYQSLRLREKEYPKDIFLNEEIYFAAILSYGISKIRYIKDQKVIYYDIVFSDENVLNKVKGVLPEQVNPYVNLILETVDNNLMYDQLVSIDNDDVTFFDSIYRFVHERYYWQKKVPSDALWVCALECNKEIVAYVKPNVYYARNKLIRSDFNYFMTNENNHYTKEEELITYLNRKIEFIKQGKKELVDLNYLEYQIVLRPINSTIWQAKPTLGRFKTILKILQPLILDYYDNPIEDYQKYPMFIE